MRRLYLTILDIGYYFEYSNSIITDFAIIGCNNMKKGGYITQQRIREENRNKILSLLKKEPQRFSSLEELTGYSPAGLTKILYELLEKKKITKIVKDNKLAYSIKKGIRLDEILFLGRILYEIKERGGKIYIDYTHSREDLPPEKVPWGVESHLVLDKNIDEKNLNPISKKDVAEMEQWLFKRIMKKVKKKRIKVDEEQEGTIVLGFRMDYGELISGVRHPLVKRGGKLRKL